VSAWELTQSIFLISGGMGMFLYGMKMLTDGLEIIAGSRMRYFLERATSNRFLGVAVGAVVTAAIQSSTAFTVMLVGFINAGLMNLTQAISLILGAAIGSTLAPHIVSFRIDVFAPLFIFIGFLLHLLSKRMRVKNTGFILLSAGILFFGLFIMGQPLTALSAYPGFQSMFTAFRNPVLAVLSGFIFTALIQSSAVTLALLITMSFSGIDLQFATVAFIVLGANAGTTVTALLASLAAGRESKRAALSQLFIRAVSCVVFGALILVSPGILLWFQNTWNDGARQIAMFHTLFNIASTLLLLPFVGYISKLMYLILPKTAGESKELEQTSSVLQYNGQTPVYSQISAELRRMGGMVLDNLRLALEAFYTSDGEKAATVMAAEIKINNLNNQITSLLTHIKKVESAEDVEKFSAMLYAASDIERIGDHAENIAEYATLRGNRRKDMHSSARDYLHVLSDTVIKIVALALTVYESQDISIVRQVEQLEDQVDRLAKECINKYIERQEDKIRDPRGGIILTEIVGDLERCADHALNIAHLLDQAKIHLGG